MMDIFYPGLSKHIEEHRKFRAIYERIQKDFADRGADNYLALDVDKDLRKWWEEASPGSSHTLRVLREESILELEVTRRHEEVSIADLFTQPLDVLRELSLLCDAIPTATLQIHNTGDEHFSALLRLRLGSRE